MPRLFVKAGSYMGITRDSKKSVKAHKDKFTGLHMVRGTELQRVFPEVKWTFSPSMRYAFYDHEVQLLGA